MLTASGSWRSDDKILTDCGVGQMAVFCRCSDTFDLPRTPGGWQLSTSASAPLPKLLIQSLGENEVHREKPGMHKLASCFARLLEFSKQSVFLEVQGVVCGRGLDRSIGKYKESLAAVNGVLGSSAASGFLIRPIVVSGRALIQSRNDPLASEPGTARR
jgi:hypothetical protein